MSDVRIDVVSEDGLSKEVFAFNYQYGALTYTSHHEVNRSTPDEIWADQEKHDIMSFRKFCEEKGLYHLDEEAEIKYNQYRQKFNPVCQKTKQGKRN